MPQYSGKIIRKNPVVPTQTSASGVWTLADAAAATRNNTWPVAGLTNPISRSVRFRRNASGYFNRTPASASNRTTWTWSGWVKRSALTTAGTGGVFGLFGGGTLGSSQANFVCYFNSTFDIYIQETVMNVSNQLIYATTSLYRDPSAWYHIVVAMDTTQATAANRTKVYVNGVQAPGAFSVTPSQNQALSINNSVPQYIGGSPVNPQAYGNVLSYFDGYITEINFIDGQQLTPSSFGTTDSTTGAWMPMPYTGTYGTNGFYLNFKDNTSTTTLGADYSGNSNNWTANAISLTAGTTYDSMVDVPTPWSAYNTAGDVGATVRGNYAAMCPLFTSGLAQETITYSQGNLVITSGTTGYWIGTGSTLGFGMSSSFYAELQLTTGASQGQAFGIVDVTNNAVLSARSGASPYSGICINHTGAVYRNGTNIANVAATTSGDVISIAFDGPNSQVIFKKNNATWYTVTSVPSVDQYVFFGYVSDGCSQTWNFGQRPFTYTPPTGFKTLNTQNLPDATIKKGNAFFDVVTRAGTGAVATVSSLSFMPDLVWGKARNNPENHNLFDSVRGVTNALRSNTTDAESTQSGVTAFNSNGYSLGAGALNNSGSTYVDWLWNAGGSTVTNTSGSITSQVRANATAGFSVVTYTGTGANATVGHGLGVAPRMIIVKARSYAGGDWDVYHASLGATQRLFLNQTAVAQTTAVAWNNTAPTSSVFTIGTGTDVNNNTSTYVAYCFAAVAGYSKFGSYTGNGSADGPFVFLGFRPAFVLVKRTDAAVSWIVEDTARDTTNPVNPYLLPNTSDAEASTTSELDFLSNGFKIRNTGSAYNTNGGTYIYMAFAENPFKYSNAR